MKLQPDITGYNQSVTGCGSQRRHVVVTQREQRKQRDPHPQIEFDFDGKQIHYNVCDAQRKPLLSFETPFMWEICGRSFKQRGNRKSHIICVHRK